MAGLMESVSTLNSFIRTLLAIVVAGAVGVASWFGYNTVNQREIQQKQLDQVQGELDDAKNQLANVETQLDEKNQEIGQLNETVKEKDAEISTLNDEVQRLDTAMRLLKVENRVARLDVLDQEEDPETGQTMTRVEFVELDDRGEPIEKPRQFNINGDVVYIDSWIVKFDDKYVEESDLHRSTSLLLFKRIYGEMQEPIDGFPLDRVGAAPRVYAQGDQVSDFEKQIWDDFWSVANDNAKQEELGISAAHGQADYIKVRRGKSYKVLLRSTGRVSIDPDDNPPLRKPAA